MISKLLFCAVLILLMFSIPVAIDKHMKFMFRHGFDATTLEDVVFNLVVMGMLGMFCTMGTNMLVGIWNT